MKEDRKKYLDENPASRRLLFMDLVNQLAQCTDVIAALVRAQKVNMQISVSVSRGLISLRFDNFALYTDGPDDNTELCQYFVSRRLRLYGERNEWLESWPELVDLLDLHDLAPWPIPRFISVSNETTGPLLE